MAETIAFRIPSDCADLVQNFALHLAFPFEGKVSAELTDEVKFKQKKCRH